MGGDFQTGLRSSSPEKYNAGKQGSELGWKYFRIGTRYYYYEMGEAIKLINFLGWTTVTLGFLSNFGNLISVFVGLAGFGYAVIKCLNGWEDYKEKKYNRSQRGVHKKHKHPHHKQDDENEY